MSRLWKIWAARYDELQRRERVLMLGMVLVCIGFIGNTLLIEPLTARKKILLEQTAGERVQVDQLQHQLAVLAQNAQLDPDATSKARMADLQRSLHVVDGELDTLQQGFVAPGKMPQLLDGLLKNNGQLKLVALKTLPLSTLPLPGNKAVKPGGTGSNDKVIPTAVNDLQVFRHGVELTVEGGYLDALNYLASLEQLPWNMLWSRAVLHAGETGGVNLTLTVYTLSLDKAWLSL